MLKAVFRPSELVALTDKIIIESPTSYPDLAHLAPIVDLVDEEIKIEEYKGPTADDLRREAEMFIANWKEEKEKMIESARNEADKIIEEAQRASFAEVKRQTDEIQVIKQQAIDEAEKIITDAQIKAREVEHEIRQSIEGERKEAMEQGRIEGKENGFLQGKSEVERLIERTQTVLERAQEKRGEILSETEKQIVDLVLLISRKIIKVISENQRNVIIHNVIEALRKVKSKGDVLIRVNLSDLELATEHKQNFIKLLENKKSLEVIEDSTVDSGGCIIQTDFGEIDARISSQLAELESKILEISPIRSSSNNTPMPVINPENIKSVLDAKSSNMDTEHSDHALDNSNDTGQDEEDISQGVNAALTASAALAALATMAQKGKRDSDKEFVQTIGNLGRRKTDA
jgi:flagellar assembly protein FliH